MSSPLRPSAARAFALRSAAPAQARPALAPNDRSEALRRLFLDLFDRFAREVEDLEGFSLGEPRTLLDGLEFRLVAPDGRLLSFLGSFDGVIRVAELSGGRLVLRELLSVEQSRAGYRSIRQPLCEGGTASGFAYANPRGLARHYLEALGAELAR